MFTETDEVLWILQQINWFVSNNGMQIKQYLVSTGNNDLLKSWLLIMTSKLEYFYTFHATVF